MNIKARTPKVLRVVVFPPAPADRFFDYLLPEAMGRVAPGSRVKVDLGRHSRIGVVIEAGVAPEVEESRLRPVKALLDEQPALPGELLKLLRWTSAYYQYPIGRVFSHAVPGLVRRGDALHEGGVQVWEACGGDQASLSRAPAQRRLFALLESTGPLDAVALNDRLPGWRVAARALLAKGLVKVRRRMSPDIPGISSPHELNPAQSHALAAINASRRFERHLLEGVTGSGKTEVYLRTAEKVLNSGGQVLMLVPEIGLTLQTVAHFRERYGSVVALLHSDMSKRSRLESWTRARTGIAKIIIGTRSAVFAPCKSLAMIVVDEEHDVAYKQQDTLRYHARDLAIKRAQLLGIPVVLGSATPSLESLCNVDNGQYRHHFLGERVGDAGMPALRVIDLRRQRLVGGVCGALLEKIEKRVSCGQQVLLFLNRRGYATQLVCHDCGTVVMCPNCDIPLVYHLHAGVVRCHHCGHSLPRPTRCARCGHNHFNDTGMGTELIEQDLAGVFPQVSITRVDADSVSGRGELERILEQIRRGGAGILIGTQMLSKGHHFPRLTLVGILNVDQRLFAPDFRSIERLGQLITQVSGRAGRGDVPGEVCLQTYHPDNAYLECLVREGYSGFARHLLTERKTARLPPHYFLALIRAAAPAPDTAMAFLELARSTLKPVIRRRRVSLLGPSPMMSEKRGGRYRAQLLLSAANREALQYCLSEALPRLRVTGKFPDIAWYVDVDPVEIE